MREVLAYLKEDPGGGGRHSKHQRDNKKFDAPNFDGSTNPNSYLKRVQSIERFFHVKEYCDEKAFKAAIHKLEIYAFLGYESTKKQRAKDGMCKIRKWTKLKKLIDKRFPVGNYKRNSH